MRLAAAILLLLATYTANYSKADESVSNTFLEFADAAKNKIALDVRSIDNFAAPEVKSEPWQNVFTDHYRTFSEDDLDAYRRVLAGMQLLNRQGINSEYQAIFLNPVFDIGFVTKWEKNSQQSFVLKRAFLLPGELLRESIIKSPLPAWTFAGSLATIGDSYRAATDAKNTVDDIIKKALDNDTYNFAGQTLNERDVVAIRVAYMTVPIQSALKGGVQEPKIRNSIKLARESIYFIRCVKSSKTFEEALICEQNKQPFKELSIPAAITDASNISDFLGSVFLEGVATTGTWSTSFLSSTSAHNNFIIALTENNGIREGISLVNLGDR